MPGTHVPFTAAEVARRYRLDPGTVEPALRRLVGAGKLLPGAFSPNGPDREYCHPDVLAALRRRSLAALRKEIEPVPVEALARFAPAWQGVGAPARGMDRLAEVVHQLQGYAMPASVLERDVLAGRVAEYRPVMLDQLMSTGEVVWAGRGSLSGGDGRVALYLRADAPRLLEPPAVGPPGEIHDRLRERLATRGACFFADLVAAATPAEREEVLDALWDLVWSGEVTNDTMVSLRARASTRPGRGRPRHPRRPLMRLSPPGAEGRWSSVSDLTSAAITATERLHATAGALLQRHGVLTREAALSEGVSGGFAGLYPVLRAMEEGGRIRRGYFVEGLGGSQFALPGAVDRLRSSRQETQPPVILAATDPANPFGVTLPWPATAAGRTARVPGAFVVIAGSQLRLYLERGGRSLLTFGAVDTAELAALAEAARRLGKVEVLTVDGEPVAGSRLERAMREVGFGVSPRGLVLWPERSASAGA